MPTITKKEFLEKFNYAPYGFKEIAELLSTVTDDEDISGVAKTYLETRENLEMILDEIGFEFG